MDLTCPFLLVRLIAITTTLTLGQSVDSVWDNVRGRTNPCLDTTCGEKQDVCVCHLSIDHRLTMMNEEYGTLVVPKGGQLYEYDKLDSPIINPELVQDILTADGNNSQVVIAINRLFPGPQITAYEGQTMIIHVRNLMRTESTTIHWHGMNQHGTTYADGAAMVSQCPIEHGQEFIYKFKAKPHGTHFYHAHIGDQRTMGLYGAFIVYPKHELPSTTNEEHVVLLQDWNHDDDAITLYQRMLYGAYDQASKTPYRTTYSRDGAKFSRFWYHSGLVNGKGRYYTAPNLHNEAPLTVFAVAPNRNYRFRVISAATLYPFRVYVEGHPHITVVASDGFALKPLVVESFIINPGERYDFILSTNKAKSNYLLVAQTLEVESDITSRGEYHVAEAIIHYIGSKKNLNLAKSGKNQCTPANRCVVFNCPYLPTGINEICRTYNDARTSDFNSRPQDVSDIDKEFFFNFAFPGPVGFTKGSVNGRQFEPPVAPIYSQPEDSNTGCNQNCEDKICKCTYTQKIQYGKVYQFTLTNLGNGKGWSHPVHLHGHSFYVMKMGFGRYDSNGILINSTSDIYCTYGGSKGYCNDPVWYRKGWNGGNVPDLVLNHPAQKDTIIVPTHGYVVIRFKADNPGAWLLHCDIDFHSTNGMAMVIIESPGMYPTVPDNFPVCGDLTETDKNKGPVCPDPPTVGLGGGIGIGISISSVVWAIVATCIVCYYRRKDEYA